MIWTRQRRRALARCGPWQHGQPQPRGGTPAAPRGHVPFIVGFQCKCCHRACRLLPSRLDLRTTCELEGGRGRRRPGLLEFRRLAGQSLSSLNSTQYPPGYPFQTPGLGCISFCKPASVSPRHLLLLHDKPTHPCTLLAPLGNTRLQSVLGTPIALLGSILTLDAY